MIFLERALERFTENHRAQLDQLALRCALTEDEKARLCPKN